MKKQLFIITIVVLFTFHFSLFTSPQAYAAVTPTPTTKAADPTVKQKLDAQINQLKDKIASRVSELNLVEKRGLIGTITEVKGNQITLTDQAGNTRYADVDEITKFSSAATKSFGLSDLTKGSKISILGIYNKQSKRILARFIKTYASPTIYSGAVMSVDPKNFQLMMMTDQQKQVKVDVDTSTQLFSYAVDADLTKYGFSKIVVGDRIIVTGFPDKTDPNMLIASRLIDYLGLPKDPRIVLTGTTTASAAAQTVTPTTATRQTNPVR